MARQDIKMEMTDYEHARMPWFSLHDDRLAQMYEEVNKLPNFGRLTRGLQFNQQIGVVDSMSAYVPTSETVLLTFRFDKAGFRDTIARIFGKRFIGRIVFCVNRETFRDAYRVALHCLQEGSGVALGSTSIRNACNKSRLGDYYAADVKYAVLAAYAVIAGGYTLEGEDNHVSVKEKEKPALPMALEPVTATDGPQAEHKAKFLRDLDDAKDADDRPTAFYRAPLCGDGSNTVRNLTDANLKSACSRYAKVQKNEVQPAALKHITESRRMIWEKVADRLKKTEYTPHFPAKYSKLMVDLATEGLHFHDDKGRFRWTVMTKLQEVIHKAKPSRPIIYVEAKQMLHEVFLCSPVESAIFDVYGEISKKKVTKDGFSQRLRGLLGLPRKLSTDFSSFDSTVGAPFQRMESQELTQAVDLIFGFALPAAFLTPGDKERDHFIATQKSFAANLPTARRSGELLTSAFNFLWNLTLAFDFLRKQQPNLTVDAFLKLPDFKLMCEGDDRLIGYDPAKHHDLGPEMIAHHARLGFQLEQVYDHHVYGEFCSDIMYLQDGAVKFVKRMKRGLERLAIQFNVGGLYRGPKGKEHEITPEARTAASTLACISLYSSLQTAIGNTPYLCELYKAAFMYHHMSADEQCYKGMYNDLLMARVQLPGSFDEMMDYVLMMGRPSLPPVSVLHTFADDLDLEEHQRGWVMDMADVVPLALDETHFQFPEIFYTHLEPHSQCSKLGLPTLAPAGSGVKSALTSWPDRLSECFMGTGEDKAVILNNQNMPASLFAKIGADSKAVVAVIKEISEDTNAEPAVRLAAEMALERSGASQRAPHVYEKLSHLGEADWNDAKKATEVARSVVYGIPTVAAIGRAISISFSENGTSFHTHSPHITVCFLGTHSKSHANDPNAGNARVVAEFLAREIRRRMRSRLSPARAERPRGCDLPLLREGAQRRDGCDDPRRVLTALVALRPPVAPQA